ncbi:caspase family protein [Candidatus Uabimicrobium amorphum]|uniref:WD40 domain-containing protein n=1 Tax=Uabimicrobium amorphum TaxID=2596890 RepID=UPI0034A14C4A
MKRFAIVFFIFVLFSVAENDSQNTIQKWIDQLQSQDRKQKIQAIKELQKIGTEAKSSLVILKKIWKEAVDKNDDELILSATKALRDIGLSVSIENNSPIKQTRKNAKQKQRATFSNVNLGGISILGQSRDFSTGLKYNKCHALVIGIDEYDHFTDLKGPNFDAAEVAEVLDLRYQFKNIVLLVDKEPAVKQGNVKWKIDRTTNRVTKETLEKCLKELKKKVKPGDALFFYYAGHGIPGYIVAADSHNDAEGKPVEESMISLKEIAEKLESFGARHTLMVLDSCFSGSLLEGKYQPQFPEIAKNSFIAHGGDNLGRVFHRRVFQVITAGAEDEVVADKLDEASTVYAQKFKDSRGHSPFTAVFLKALYGLVGRADGTILTSQLGYHMTDTLINDKRIGASQAPRYEAIYGNGDFMFFPAARKVLNPKLLSNLYLTDKDYTDLRRSACEALEKFIFSQRQDLQSPLVQNVIPHMIHMLDKDEPVLSLKPALKFLLHMAREYGDKDIRNFSQVIEPLTKLLEFELKEASKNGEIREDTALILGYLHPYATVDAVKQMGIYVGMLKKEWPEKKKDKAVQLPEGVLPPLVQERENRLKLLFNEKPLASDPKIQMKYWGDIQRDYHRLYNDGWKLLLEYKNKIENYNILMVKADEVYPKSLDEVEINSKTYMKQEQAYRECGTYAGKALHYIKDLKGVGVLRERAKGFVRLAFLQRKEIWRSPVYGDTSEVNSVAFSPDGKTFASCSGNSNFSNDEHKDYTVRLWDVATGKEIHKITGHTDSVNSVAFSPDGETFASGSHDTTVALWDVATGKEITKITGHTSWVRSVAFSPDGKTLASGSVDETVRLWDVATGKLITKITGHANDVNSVAFSPDGKTLASGSDRTVRLWDIVTGKEITKITGHTKGIRSLAFSPDGKTLASSGSHDTTVVLWDIVTRKEIHKITGHTSYVNSVAFSPDGKTLASGSVDRTVRLWDVATGKQITKITGHTYSVWSVAFSPDGKTLASGSLDETVRLWDVATGKEITKITGHTDRVNSVAFSPDGKTLASASGSYNIRTEKYKDCTVRLWDVTSGKEITTITEHTASVLSVAFSPDGKTIASGAGNIFGLGGPDGGSVKLWDVATGKKIHKITGHTNRVNSVAFSPNGKTLASGSGDKTVRLWDVATGKEITTITVHAHTYSVLSVAFSPDGKILASGSDATVRLWDVATGKEIHKITGHTNRVNSVAFSPDGKILASGSDDATVRLWDVATGKEIHKITGHTYSVLSVAFSPDGKTLASGSEDNTVRLWDVATGKLITKITGHANDVNSVAFSPDGKTLASASGGYNIQTRKYKDCTVRLWDVTSGKEITTITAHTYPVLSVAFSPDGKTLASASGGCNTPGLGGPGGGSVRLWDVATGKEITKITGHTNHVKSVAFSPDGKTLASGSDDKTVRLWDVATGKKIHKITGHTNRVNSVAFSPNSKTLASGSDDKTVRLWDVTSGKQIRKITGHTRPVKSVAFSPDGKTIASGGTVEGTVRLWDVATGKLITKITKHFNVNSVAFSPDGKTLTSGSIDKTVLLWDIDTGKEITEITGHTDRINSVVFSPNGRTIASGSDDKTVRLWDVASGKEIAKMTGHASRVNSVAFSPDGKTLASGSVDRTVRLWDVATGKQITKITGHTYSVWLVAFSPDGKALASGSGDKTVRLWDVATGKEITKITGHTSRVNSVAFSPDGKTFASCSGNSKFSNDEHKDYSVRLWDVATEKEITKITGHADDVKSVAFSPDGKTLASGSLDETVRLWDLATGKEITSFTKNRLLWMKQNKKPFHPKKSFATWLFNIALEKNPQEITESLFFFHVNNNMKLEKQETRYLWQSKEYFHTNYPWTDEKAYGINQKLWQAYLNKNISNIKQKDLEYLSNFTRKDYIDTIAVIYTLQQKKLEAKKYAKKGSKNTQMRVKLLLKGFSPQEVEIIVKDGRPVVKIFHQKLSNIYQEEKIDSIDKRELKILAASTEKDHLETVAVIYAWLGNKALAEKFAASAEKKTQLHVQLLLEHFSPKEVESFLDGSINTKLWQIYSEEKKSEINNRELLLLSRSQKSDELNTVAAIYAWLGNEQKAKELAAKANQNTSQRVQLLLEKYSPGEVEAYFAGNLGSELKQKYQQNKTISKQAIDLLAKSQENEDIQIAAVLYAWQNNKQKAEELRQKISSTAVHLHIALLLQGLTPQQLESLTVSQKYLHHLTHYQRRKEQERYNKILQECKEDKNIATLPIRDGIFSPNGQILAGMDANHQKIMFFDVKSGDLVQEISMSKKINHFAFANDNKLFALAFDNGEIKLIDLSSANKVAHSWKHSQVQRVAFSKNGKYLASGDGNGKIQLWEITSGKKIAGINKHQDAIKALAFSPTAEIFASASADNTAQVFNTQGTLLHKFSHEKTVISVAFSPDGKLLASSDENGTAIIWDTKTGKEIHKFTDHKDWVYVAFAPHGKALLTSADDYFLRLWQLSTGKVSKKMTGHTNYIYAVSYSPDGKYFTSSTENHTRLWNATTGKQIHAQNRLEWKMLEFYRGEITEQDVLLALGGKEQMGQQTLAKFYYYAGLHYIANGEKQKARRYFTDCLAQNQPTQIESKLGIVELAAMK